MPTRRLSDAGRFWLLYAILLLAFAALWTANSHATVTGEWRVNLIRGSTTVQPASVGATQEAAWAACLARIPATATTSTSYKCQTPVYAATVTPDPPPTCPAKPADQTQPGVCPAGTTGSWTQTLTHTSAAAPTCWVAGAWSPSSPPAGACVAAPPPPADLTAPTLAPPAISANATNPANSNVTLNWTAVTGATSYEVERCSGATCTNFVALPASGFTGPTTYLNNNLPPGLTYRYRTRAADATRKGTYSAIVSATTLSAPPPPPPPTGANTLSLNVGGAAIAGYTADQYFVGGSVSSNCNRPVTGVYATRRYSSTGFEYRIPLPNARYLVRLLWNECWHTAAGQRVFRAGVEGLAVATVDPWRADGAVTTNERIVDLTDGVLNIQLTAVTGDAMLNAIEVAPTTGQPIPPTVTHSTTLNWTPPATNTDGTPLTNLAGFRIYYGTAPGALTQTLQVANAGLASFIVDKLSAGSWYFAVSAYSNTGTESAQSNTVTRTFP